MAYSTPRTFVNRGGVSYDATKTSVIFAEDMNKLKDNDAYLKETIENLPPIPTDISDLTDESSALFDPTLPQGFLNKRIVPRIISTTSYTTNTGTSLTLGNCDEFVITAQAGPLKFNNPLGTPLQGEKLIIRIKDNGTARALTYDTQFRAMGVALPSTTVISKTMYLGFIYNSTDTKWDLVAVAQEA